MKTYLVFNSKTGDVIAAHSSDDGHASVKEQLLAMLSEHEKEHHDVIEARDLAPGQAYRIDPKTRTPVPVPTSEVKGFGGANRPTINPGQASTVRTEYFKDCK
jgi:hypothetical protein